MPSHAAAVPLGVTVRLAEARDLDGLVGLLDRCVGAMQAGGLDQWDQLYPNRATLEADLQSSGTLYLAVREAIRGGAEDLCGSFTMNQQEDPAYAEVAWQITSPPIAVIHRLMIDPGVQRQGLGRFLMGFAERRALQLGFRTLRLDTRLDNDRALALYRGLGYRDAGRVSFHLRKGRFACFEKALDAAG
jgi:ribosomal protein S18 acetylase RimI-like enzyme